MLALATISGHATTYTYTSPATGTTSDTWSTGTHWGGSTAPVSSSTTVLTFNMSGTGASGTVLDTSKDDISGAFQLTTLNLATTATNGSQTFTLSAAAGSSLSFTGTTNTITVAGSSNVTDTISSNIAFTNGLTLSNTGSFTSILNLTGTLSGSGGLTINGLNNGTRFVLGAAATYTGGTILNSGIFAENGADLNGTGTLTLNGGIFQASSSATVNNAVMIGGNVQLDDAVNIGISSPTFSGTINLGGSTTNVLTIDDAVGHTITFSNVVSNGGLTMSGKGALLLSNAANTYTGGTKVEGGTLLVGAAAPSGANGALGNSTSAIVLGDSQSAATNNIGLLTNGAYTVGLGVAVDNTNTTGIDILGGGSATTSTFSGAISLNGHDLVIAQDTGGTLNITGGIRTGTSANDTVTFGNYADSSAYNPGGTALNNMTGTINVGTTAISDANGGHVSVNIAAAPVTFSVANTYSGATLVAEGGTLKGGVANILSIGSSSATTVILGGNVANLSGSALTSASKTVTVSSTAGLFVGETVTDTTTSGNIAGGTTITAIISPTKITISANATATAASDTLAFSDTGTNTFDLGGHNQEIDGLATGSALSSASNAVITNTGGTATLTINNDSSTTNANFTFGGVIQSGSGVVNVAKSGNKTLTLSGANTYTGTTAINGGTLSISSVATGASAQGLGENTGTNAVTLGVAGTSSGTLQYTGGSGTLDKSITALGNGANTIQNSGTGLLTLSGTLTKNDTALVLNGGTNGILVTGKITSPGAVNAFDSDLYATGLVTADNANNNYTGATHVYGNGTLVNGLSGALPSSTVVELGNSDTIAAESGSSFTNTYELGGFNQTVAGVTSTNPSSFTDTNAVIGGSATLSTLTVAVASGTDTYSGYLGTGTAGANNNNNLALSKTGAGNLVLTSANTYTGGTSIAGGGTVYVQNTSNSGTGTDGVTVTSGTLAGNGIIAPTTTSSATGVTVGSGGNLASGNLTAIASVANTTSVGAGTGMTLNNSANLSSILDVNGGKLTFALGSGNPTGAGTHTYGNPNTSSTYLTVTGNTTGEINFAGAVTVALDDLTSGSLSLRTGTPYLLISAGLDSDYAGLITATGGGSSLVYSLNGDGFVVGVITASGLANEDFLGAGNAGNLSSSDYTAISIAEYGADGVTPLTGSNIYPAPALYLDAGNLEVVPEPGTWALMLGGLALLAVIQRRRNNRID